MSYILPGRKIITVIYISGILLFFVEFCWASRNRNPNKCIWTRCSVNPSCPSPFVTKMTVPCKPRRRMRTRNQCCRNSTMRPTTLPPGGSTTDPPGPINECQKANIAQVPYQVALVQTSVDGSNDVHFCSGVVYDENFVITTGNYTGCVSKDDVAMTASNFRIQAGDTNLNRFEGTEQLILVEKVILHENYMPASQANDIALLKLVSPMMLGEGDASSAIPVLALPLPRNNFDASTAGSGLVAGWSVTKLFNGDNSGDPSLHAITVPIYPGRACGPCRLCVLSDAWHPNCKCDVGGALACNDGGTKVACGILSVSSSSTSSPNIYSDISCYSEWIRRTVDMNSFSSLHHFLASVNSTAIIVDQF